MASGLKMNLHKSNMFVVGILICMVQQFASLIGSKVAKSAFMYIVIPVGAFMSNYVGWEPMISSDLFLLAFSECHELLINLLRR